MQGLFTAEQVNVAQAMDIIELTLGDRKIRLYYPTAFKFSGQLRVCGKEALLHAGENIRIWRDLAEYAKHQQVGNVHRTYRRSGYLSNLKREPVVTVEGELVVAQLDDLVVKFFCVDALRLQASLHVAALKAKAWAGDDSNAMIVTARLTNATPDGTLRSSA